MMAWTARRRNLRAPVFALDADRQDQVAVRRAAATDLVGVDAAAGRVGSAPPGYLLAHGSSDIARHCELLTPCPASREVRVVGSPGRIPGEWHLDVASRDRPGLLATFTGVLAGSGIDVVQAVVATWDDGAALEAFVIRSATSPDSPALQRAFASALDQPLLAACVADACVTFPDRPSALYTACEVQAADRAGLLHAVAVAIATAGADVHAARVTTTGGVAHDRFDLSDRDGQRLDAALKAAIHSRITGRI